jgi:hypothetical protein
MVLADQIDGAASPAGWALSCQQAAVKAILPERSFVLRMPSGTFHSTGTEHYGNGVS